jgi:hypothetical protein
VLARKPGKGVRHLRHTAEFASVATSPQNVAPPVVGDVYLGSVSSARRRTVACVVEGTQHHRQRARGSSTARGWSLSEGWQISDSGP